MKLYFDPAERSWQLPGQQAKSAVRVDVPGAPAELAAWLTERGVEAERTATADAPAPSPRQAEASVEWILDTGTPAQIEQLFVAFGVRFHELRTELLAFRTAGN